MTLKELKVAVEAVPNMWDDATVYTLQRTTVATGACLVIKLGVEKLTIDGHSIVLEL